MSSETSKQFDLFTQVFNHEKPASHLSNLISFWDSIPKYSRSRSQQAAMRDENGRLPTLRHQFLSSEGEECEMILKPASITRDGKTMDYYPSENEEILEDIFLKILIMQNHGQHDPVSGETMCKFTGGMIMKELARHKKGRNYSEFKLSVEIMQDSKIEVIVNGKSSLRTSILPTVIFSDRERYKDDPTSMTAVTLSPAISRAINRYAYRQYNYDLVIDMKYQLSRWLYKRIADRYINAGAGAPEYRIKYSEIKRDSGMLNQNTTSKQLSIIRRSLDELIKTECISQYKEDVKVGRDGRTILDVTFSFRSKADLIRDIILANTRKKAIKSITSKENQPSLPKKRLSR